MNNTRYLDWVDDLLTSEFHKTRSAREFVICYLNEAMEGQQIRLNWTLSPEGCLQVDAHREAETPARVFSAQLLF